MRLLLFAVVLSGAGAAHAGAWPQPVGSGYYKLGAEMIRGDDFREADGTAVHTPTLAAYTVSLYGEYGFRDGLTVLGYLPAKRITLNKLIGRPSEFVYFDGDQAQGVADVDLGLRFRLWQKGGTVASAQLTFGVPLGDDEQASGLLTGDGELNQRLSLQVGHSLWPAPAWVSADLGYDRRTGGYSDQIRYAAEIGATWRERLTVILRLLGTEAREDRSSSPGGTGGLYASDQGYLSYGPELIYAWNGDFAVSASVLTASRMRNVLAAPSFSVGLSTQR